MSALTPVRDLSSRSKPSKFKPALPAASTSRRAALADFATPGFKAPIAKTGSFTEPVYVSSDSSPASSSRSSVKRQSSAISIPDSPPIKKLKKAVTEPKSVLSSSNLVNNATPEPRPNKSSIVDDKVAGLSGASEATLNQSERCAQKLQKYIAKERMAFQSGLESDGCDILYGSIDTLIKNHLTAIAQARQGESPTCQPIRPALSERAAEKRPATSFKENVPPPATTPVATSSSIVSVTPTLIDDDDDAAYWNNMDDIIPPDHAECSSHVNHQPPAPVKRDAGQLRSSPYYHELQRRLRDVFKLQDFRTNQLEAVTAALDGQDVFVLMPTGGGKSLCYQLPAVCTSGKTKGVTVVVSPLLALMKDQVDSLHAKNVDALLSNSETFGEDWKRLVTNSNKPQLWYVTPEKLKDSPKVNEILSILNRGGILARFVIDEAHCISTWGQDFREAYTALGSLRDKFPQVPIMALTATANKRTVADIVTQLNLKPGHASFTQSFNRTNLNYRVVNKKGSPTNDIVSFIKQGRTNQTGVIYCTARKTCEKVADELRKQGLNAAHFHAGMDSASKDQTVRDWQNNAVRIIVATIAFGMGIDKADVRYVIHYDMPKSISGYYQETGRAGRDGLPSVCLMYYSGSDLHKLRSQIRSSEGITPDSMRRQELAVEEVWVFCRKTSICRRVQLLRHFDEVFDPQQCKKNCDVCIDTRQPIKTDATEHAMSALQVLKRMIEGGATSITHTLVTKILRGSTASDVTQGGYTRYPEHGICKKVSKELLDLVFDELFFRKIITKVSTKNMSGFHNDYLAVGEAADQFLANKETIEIEWHLATGKEGKAKEVANTPEPISAPPRSRGRKKKVIEDDPIENDDMYDMDDEPVEEIQNVPVVIASRSAPAVVTKASAVIPPKPQPEPVREDVDPVTALYQKMLALRAQIMVEKKCSEDDVLADDALQYLSAICPTDYEDFQRELANSIFIEGAEAVEVAKTKWHSFGQKFLSVCIEHKTRLEVRAGGGSTSAPKPEAMLRTRYEYVPPSVSAGPSRTTSLNTAPASKPKSKFKPSLPQP